MDVFIDPRSTINYSSFYVQGLYDYFGKSKVHFSSRYFRELEEIDMLMAFVLVKDGEIKKIIVDYRDQADIINAAFHWADTYAKINVNDSTLSEKSDKLINITPSFAIKIWNPVELLFHVCINFFKAGIIRYRKSKNIHLRPKQWCRNYASLLKRQTLESYTRKTNKPINNYVFFVSTFWKGQTNTNTYRNQYLLSCGKRENINFEGGFFTGKQTDIPDSIPQRLRYTQWLSNRSYLENIKQSVFVFNTPAVHNCHGWKLGEFLCMGKAIISTPLSNHLPFPLEHKQDILIVDNEEDIEDAISTLLNDEELRNRLEQNAKIYYEKYAKPFKVIEDITNHTFRSM